VDGVAVRRLARRRITSLQERVRVESNHRARLRRASLYSPELRTLGCRTGVEPGQVETDRARAGTYPGHNRALCPVKLRPPRLPVSDTHRRPHSGSSRFRACDLRRFTPALLPPELQSHRVTRSLRQSRRGRTFALGALISGWWTRRDSNPRPSRCKRGALPN
jgi:hypothetical protein